MKAITIYSNSTTERKCTPALVCWALANEVKLLYSRDTKALKGSGDFQKKKK